MSVNAYRFSIAWTRIISDGREQVNQLGIDYYNNLINELIANGITPAGNHQILLYTCHKFNFIIW